MKQMITTFTALALIAAPASAAPAVGDPAPNFTLPDASGKRVSLSDFRGKRPVVLIFGSFT